MGFSVYVYYRVPEAREAAFREVAEAMQARLAGQCGVRSVLKRRPSPKDGLHTWMEVYETVPEEFDSALAAAVRDSRLLDWIEGERHREVFEDVASCV